MKTILILDDFESSAWITTQTLKQLNAKFITCTDSIVALNHFLNNEDIDLLITDLNMPKMNGIELIQKIKYIEKYFTLPVIILTTEIKEEMKTSEEWQQQFECMVYDPDGWDRHNYQYSWFEEKITEKEFLKSY